MSSGSAQNYITAPSRENTAASGRDALKTELPGKLQFNVAEVMTRINVQDVSRDFVKSCRAAFEKDKECINARTILQDVVSTRGAENKMYAPLQTIFDFITEFGDPPETQGDSCFIRGDDQPLIIDLVDLELPKEKPDISIVPRELVPRPKPSKWRCSNAWWKRNAFGEVKVKEADGPQGATPGTVKEIVAQTADYARYHLAGRPFQLYSIGFLIFGNKFCVGIYDRAGVQFSPIYDIWDDFRTFVKVVRAMTRHMTVTDYGMDPTVRMLSTAEAAQWRQQTLHNVGAQSPAYEVSLGGTSNPQKWITVGRPVWLSVSLLGRGTLVWKVFNMRRPQQCKIMKNAWRRTGRSPESRIYTLVPQRHPGVSVLEEGSDVRVPGSDVVISTAWIRGEVTSTHADPIGDEHAILHRLFIETVGRPLWEYRNELELLKGIRAALAGHEFLCNNYILHRDISVGNVLLAENDSPEEGGEGFVTDLEFAYYFGSEDDVQQWTNSPKIHPSGHRTEPTTVTRRIFDQNVVQRGAVMTGTLQFMSQELLEYMANAKLARGVIVPVQAPKHDIESFLWVLCYTILRRLAETRDPNMEDTQSVAKDLYSRFFGHVKLASLSAARTGQGPFSMTKLPPIERALSVPMFQLLIRLRNMWTKAQVVDSESAGAPFELTHQVVQAALDEAIARLETSL
ncbi:hypothetical protein OBBRIDRAFT_839738 [Obba rivulosa]|uniref:Protein kinase domain-containing protein n=1 Tax=Obba rivulosa TaxID=1052685 RepID=A0A8E2API7_9APHY|nr:hypothetical protein OBBRIDRAFT_839738 [Obba rivulosa]